jgi:hypothetical protein
MEVIRSFETLVDFYLIRIFISENVELFIVTDVRTSDLTFFLLTKVSFPYSTIGTAIILSHLSLLVILMFVYCPHILLNVDVFNV